MKRKTTHKCKKQSLDNAALVFEREAAASGGTEREDGSTASDEKRQ